MMEKQPDETGVNRSLLTDSSGFFSVISVESSVFTDQSIKESEIKTWKIRKSEMKFMSIVFDRYPHINEGRCRPWPFIDEMKLVSM